MAFFALAGIPEFLVAKTIAPRKRSSPKIEFPFVIEALASKKLVIKKMFGCTALYLGPKILLIFRLKEDHLRDNGIWIATLPEHHESLRQDFPTLRDIELFGGGPTTWQNLPMAEISFESDAERACEMILRGDKRFGKIPAKKKKSASSKSKLKRPRKSHD